MIRGLVLGGGEGSRLAADGIAAPKATVPVKGVPQLDRLVRLFHEAGISDLTCLLREGPAMDWAGTEAAAGVRVVPCRTDSSLETLRLGFEAVAPGSICCSMVDTVMSRLDWSRAVGEIERSLDGGADACLVVTPFVADERPLYLDVGPDGRVEALGPGSRRRELVTGGLYGLGPAARAAIGRTVDRGAIRMRDYLGGLVELGLDIRAVVVSKIIDLDRAADLAMAEELLTDEELSLVRGPIR